MEVQGVIGILVAIAFVGGVIYLVARKRTERKYQSGGKGGYDRKTPGGREK